MNTRTCTLRLGLASTLTLGALLAVATLPSLAATDPVTAPSKHDTDLASLPLEQLDSDHDGVASPGEVGTWLRAQGNRSPLSTAALGAASIAQLDKNRDGNYTLADRPEAEGKARTLIEWQVPPTRVASDDDDDE